MKIVVDTNILFSFFWEYSFTRKLLISRRFDFISPEFALSEIKKYKKDIKSKSKISDEKFIKFFSDLKKHVTFVKKNHYKNFLKEAKEISPDMADTYFFALCLKEDAILWSNDHILKSQDKIKVVNTKEFVSVF